MEFSNHRSSSIVNRNSTEQRYSPTTNSHADPEYFSKKEKSVMQKSESNPSKTSTKNSNSDPVLQDESITNDQEQNTFESVALDSPKKTDSDKQYAPQPEDQDSKNDDEDIYVDVEHMPSNTTSESPIDEYSGKEVEESDPIDNPSLY